MVAKERSIVSVSWLQGKDRFFVFAERAAVLHAKQVAHVSCQMHTTEGIGLN
jgi:hypothetical protein